MTTWRTSRTTSRWSSTPKSRATQNFVKDKITGRVNIFWRIFRKFQKVKNEVAWTEKPIFWFIYLKSFKKLTFNFFAVSQKTRTCFFLQFLDKLNISAIYESIILIFSVNLPLILIYKFCKKRISNPTIRRTS